MEFPVNYIFEESTPISNPIDEVADLYEKTMKDIDGDLKIPKDVLSSFQIKNDLNPEIWKGDKILPEIKNNLIKVAKDFFKQLELPNDIKIKDILFTGSLANYNWSKFSDIDLHIVTDFKNFHEDPAFIKKFFDNGKSLWNDTHDINIHGYPVEIYVQDVKEKLSATAVYSLLFDKWILMPDKQKFRLDKANIKKRVEKFFNKIKDIRNDYLANSYQDVVDKVTKLKAEIKKMRKSGLESGGEFSVENLAFKVLRRTDLMDLIDSYKNKAYDKLVSVNEDI